MLSRTAFADALSGAPHHGLLRHGHAKSSTIPGMTLPEIPEFVRNDLTALQIDVPDELLARMGTYLRLLLEENRHMNLTAVREPDAAWRRLIVDSLTVLPGLGALATGQKVIDVGSGGGLPGLPLAIARPDLCFTLLEATGKKARFLQACVEEMKLDHVTVINERAETVGQQPAHRSQYDLVVSRAIGTMAVVLEYCLPLAKQGGLVLAMKGPKVQQELTQCGDAMMKLGAGEVQVIEAYPESFGNDLVIVVIAKAQATPKQYPRTPGTPQRDPLG